MGAKMPPLGAGWQPWIDRSLARLSPAGLDLRAIWSAAAQRDAAFERLRQLLDLVVRWNERVDLTAARTPEELVDLYLADALVLLGGQLGEEAGAWVDVGSGAGAPGLVLQVLRPELDLTLVEPRAKRIAFLRTVLGSLELGAKLVGQRSEVLLPQSSDVAVSRATFPPEVWLAEGARLARRSVWVLLARGPAPEQPGWQLVKAVEYEWPLTRAPRRALCFRRS
jgi:16S rRNA (guanine527-N7)-methyltransferase